jgi:hypothetical protein
MIQSDAFIQLIDTHKIILSFISETKEGAKGKIVERQRERERECVRERALGGGRYSIGCKWTVRKYTCLINKMVNIRDEKSC